MATSSTSTSSSAIGAGAGSEVVATVTSAEKTEAQNYFEKYGPICNSEGYYQHSGECWSDAFQMLMLYSDGIKEITQPLFINHTITYDEIQEKFINFILLKQTLYKKNDDTAFVENNLQALFNYFKIIQQRFQRHYISEAKRLEKFGTVTSYSESYKTGKCLDDLVTLSLLGRSPNTGKLTNKPGVQAAVMSKMTKEFLFESRENILKKIQNKNKKEDYNTTGRVEIEIKNLMKIYDMFFDINFTYEINHITKFKYNPEVLGMYLHIVNWGNTLGHAITFFTCGGNDYYFDNNRGIILFPWRKFLTRYAEESEKQKTRLYIGGDTKIFTITEKNKNAKSLYDRIDIHDVIYNTTMWPFIEYKKGGWTYYVTYFAEKEEALETTFTPMLLRRGKASSSIIANTNNLLFMCEITESDSTYSINTIVDIYKKDTTYKPTEYNAGSGKFIQARIRPGYTTIPKKNTTTTSTTGAVSAANTTTTSATTGAVTASNTTGAVTLANTETSRTTKATAQNNKPKKKVIYSWKKNSPEDVKEKIKQAEKYSVSTRTNTQTNKSTSKKNTYKKNKSSKRYRKTRKINSE